MIKNRIVGLEYHRADSLVLNKDNFRKHPTRQIKYLNDAIAEIGIAGACLAWKCQETGKLTLIDGHLRASLNPEAELPVLVLDLTDEEAKKLLLTYDSVTGLAKVDKDLYNDLFKQVEFSIKNLRIPLFNHKEVKLDIVREEPKEQLTTITITAPTERITEHYKLCAAHGITPKITSTAYTKGCPAIFDYLGAKKWLVEIAWSIFTNGTYWEPFAGSAAVFLGRPPQFKMLSATLNDKNRNVINFFRAVKAGPHADLLKFYDTCEETKILTLIDKYRNAEPPNITDDGEDFDIDRAALFYFCSQFIFKNNNHKLHYLIDKAQQVYYDDDRKRNLLLHLQLCQHRISQTILTTKDWLDSYLPATNIFFDPPYEGTEKVYAEKSVSISTEVRNWIIAHLQSLERANVIICGYDKEHDDLLEFGFKKESFVRFNIRSNPTAETIWYQTAKR